MREQEWFGPVELCVPCHKRMMLVVRMTVTGVASRFNLTLDAMDDLKMAVEEACQGIILQEECFETLKMCFDADQEKLQVYVSGQNRRLGSETAACMSLCTLDVLRCILESMVDAVEIEEDGHGLCSIKLTKNLTLDA